MYEILNQLISLLKFIQRTSLKHVKMINYFSKNLEQSRFIA